MAAIEQFDHIPVGVVTAGGTTTSDTAWTVTATTAFPAASPGSVQFHVCDPAATSELILVTTSPGSASAGQSWTVVRGADGTTPVAHTGGFTIYQVVPASWLNGVVAAGTPLTTKGDLLYENATPALARLPIGTAGQALITSTSGLPSWAAAPAYVVTPSGDTSGATDAANLAAALAAGPVAAAAGTFWFNSVIQIPGNAVLIGQGPGNTTFKMAASANLGAVAASSGWTANTNTSSVNPAYIRGITFDGNSSGQASGTGHGLVLQTFYSYVEDCVFQNTRGDGLRFDYYGANGSTNITNTAVENRAVNCRCLSNGGIGINVNDPSFAAFTDGWITDCTVSSPGAQAIQVVSGSGWRITGNHAYGGIPQSAILIGRAYMTRITGNYIESWGSSASSGDYGAIDLATTAVNDAGSGSVIYGNTCNLTSAPGNAASLIAGIQVEAASGDTGTVSITGNALAAIDNTHPANYTAISLVCQNAAATLNAVVDGNQFAGHWGNGTIVETTNSGTINLTGFDPATISVQKTFAGPGTTPTGHWFGAITTDDITVQPNSGISTSASMFLDNNAGQVFEFFCDTSPSFGVFDKTFGAAMMTIFGGATPATVFATKVELLAGTTALEPLLFQSGTNLTSAVAGAVEYDGASLYMTNETTSGRGLVPVEQKFRLTATGGNISTIANYFGTTSNISLVANAEYEIEIDCWFLKNTAGTVTWTFTNSAAPTAMNLAYKLSPATGIVSTAANTALFGEQYDITATAPTVVSASLTTAVNHHHQFWIRLINGAGTSLKIQATAGAGSITPGINSAWKCRRVPAANVGAFSA